MSFMRAVVQEQYGGAEVLRVEKFEKPFPKENEVLVKIHAAAVNDYDWARMRGEPYLYRLMFGIANPKIKIPGMELSGVVEALGPGATKFKVGDAVYGDVSDYGFGAFAEYTCVNENGLSIKPEFMGFDDAAAIPHAGLLALQGLVDVGKLQNGQKVLINGAGGGVGTFALHIAKQYGAEVTGVDSGDKLNMLSSLGYLHTIDYEDTDFTKNGLCYDLILDAKTSRSPLEYIRSLSQDGKYITVGGRLNRLLQIVILKNVVRKFYKKTIAVVALKPNKGLDHLEKLYKEGQLVPVIDGPYPLNDVPRLVQYFGEGRHKGKIIVNPWK